MRLILLIIAFVVVSFVKVEDNTSDKNKRSFIDGNYFYEISILEKNPKMIFKKDVKYHWYKLNKIYSSYYDVGGRLLNGQYLKTNLKDKSITEKGNFKDGLKDHKWKEWHPNGKIKTVTTWSHGKREGLFMKFDLNGNLIEKGNYRNNKKNGKWINTISKDTINYRGGKIKIKKIKKETTFFKRLFTKKDNLEKIEIKRKKW